ncbi:MAG: hypothetical protein ACYDG2_22450 [Ruminiclostridium sp.]
MDTKELNFRLAESHKMLNQSQQLQGADKVLELQAPAKKQGIITRIFRKGKRDY